MEVDGHAKDSSYRGKGPTSERTISTRNKNGKGSGSSADSKKSSDEDGKYISERIIYCWNQSVL
jgi:hypothetical protein